MLTLEKLRQIEPDLKQMPDEELRRVRDALHAFSRLILDSYRASRGNPEAFGGPLYGLVLVGYDYICDNE